MEQLRALQKVAAGFGFVKTGSSVSIPAGAGKGTIMTDTAVKQLINEQVAAAVKAMKKEPCPHCGEVIGAAKVSKAKNTATVTEEFFRELYYAPELKPMGRVEDLFR